MDFLFLLWVAHLIQVVYLVVYKGWSLDRAFKEMFCAEILPVTDLFSEQPTYFFHSRERRSVNWKHYKFQVSK